MKVIVYGDFNSLYCYLASQRADRLFREGKADVEWCAVEHRPRLPVIGAKPPPGSVGAQDDLAEAAQLALPGEQLPAGPPAVISNTRAAVSAYAEAVADGIQARLRLRLRIGHPAERGHLQMLLEVLDVGVDVPFGAHQASSCRPPLSLPSAWARTGADRIVLPGRFRFPGRTTGPAPGGSGLAQRLQGPPCTCRDLKVELDVGQAEIVAGHLADALEAVLEGAAMHR